MGKRSDALPNIRMDYTGFLYNEWMDDDQRMQGEEFLAENFPGREDIELEVGTNVIWWEDGGKYVYTDGGFEWYDTMKVYVYPDTTTPVDFSQGLEVPVDFERGGAYFTYSDLYGWGGTFSASMRFPDTNDPSSALAVRMTENGYNVEICPFQTAYNEGPEYGVNVVLTDVHDGGTKKSVYTLNRAAEPLDWKEMDYFTLGYMIAEPLDDNGEALDAAGREVYINAQLGDDAPEPTVTDAAVGTGTSADTAGSTDTGSTDGEQNDSGNTGMIICIVAAAIVVVVVMKKKNGKKQYCQLIKIHRRCSFVITLKCPLIFDSWPFPYTGF